MGNTLNLIEQISRIVGMKLEGGYKYSGIKNHTSIKIIKYLKFIKIK